MRPKKQINTFDYLGYNIRNEEEKNLTEKIVNCVI